jgi:hypothetical protein
MTFVRWSPVEDERLRKLALSGFSLGQIAGQMERSKSSVRTRALKMNIAIAYDRNPMQKPANPSAGLVELGLKAKSK